jgi:Ca-activated chloride channel homolog
MVAAWIAVGAMLVVAAAEWLHARRIRRLGYLAFGPAGRPARWVRAVPFIRIAGLGALTWGLVVLWQFDAATTPTVAATEPDEPAHLVLALDVSPSMDLVDSGPLGKDSRAARAREVLGSILDRLDLRHTRVSVIAFFSSARPVVVDTHDREVVANILQDLPLEQAFSSGKTKLYSAVEAAGEIGSQWRLDSATLVLVSDGDTLPPEKPLPLPPAFGDVLILGVGDPNRGEFIDGHVSRQDRSSLEQLALRLSGDYLDVNARHVPTQRVSQLPAVLPDVDRTPWNLREFATAALLLGATCLALVGPLLALFGGAFNPARARPHLGFTFRTPAHETA